MFTIKKKAIKSNFRFLCYIDFMPSLVNLDINNITDMLQRLHIKRVSRGYAVAVFTR